MADKHNNAITGAQQAKSCCRPLLKDTACTAVLLCDGRDVPGWTFSLLDTIDSAGPEGLASLIEKRLNVTGLTDKDGLVIFLHDPGRESFQVSENEKAFAESMRQRLRWFDARLIDVVLSSKDKFFSFAEEKTFTD
jgi:hypothetical protein